MGFFNKIHRSNDNDLRRQIDEQFQKADQRFIEVEVRAAAESGHDDRSESTVSFDDGTRTFTIAPVGDSFTYYDSGVRYIKTAADSVVIPDDEGLHVIYYEGDTLKSTTVFTEAIIIDYTITGAVYWDATNSKGIMFGEERHGRIMDSATHAYNHNTTGSRYDSGLSLANMTVDGSGNNAIDAQFSVENGIIWDEDLENHCLNNQPQAMLPIAEIPIFYVDGASAAWRRVDATQYPIATTGSGRAAWNEYTGAVWQVSEVANNDFVLVHYFATNDLVHPIIGVMGQAEYQTVSAAREGASVELFGIQFGQLSALTPEFVAIATVIWQTSNSYTNAVKSRVRSTDAGTDYVDWREQYSPIGGSAGVFLPDTFAGAGAPGYVPDPVTESGYFLRDDATWQAIVQFPEAPVDGTTYGRLNSSWAAVYTQAEADAAFAAIGHGHVVFSAGVDGFVDAPVSLNNYFLRDDNTWVENVSFPEAPVSSFTYGRDGGSGTWNAVYTRGEADAAFALIGHVHAAFTTTVDGFVPNPGVSNRYFLRDDGVWDDVSQWQEAPNDSTSYAREGEAWTNSPAFVGIDAGGKITNLSPGTAGTDAVTKTQLDAVSAEIPWTISGDDIYNTNDDNIGLGTSSPNVKVHMELADASRSWSPTATNVVAMLENSGNCYLDFVSGATSNARINFGTPSDEDRYGIWVNHNANVMQIRYGGAERIRFFGSNGRMALGQTSASEMLEVNGNVLADNVSVPSDMRFKTNVSRLTESLDRVAMLNGYEYDIAGRREAGVSAQEVELVLPTAIGGTDERKTVHYNQVIALLVNAVNELRAEVDYLRSQIE